MRAASSRSKTVSHRVRVAKASGQFDRRVEGLTRDLESARAAQEKRFTQIVRHVARRLSRPTSDMLAKIRLDERLCLLLAEYEKESEIVGMIDMVRELIVRASRRRNVPNSAGGDATKQIHRSDADVRQ